MLQLIQETCNEITITFNILNIKLYYLLNEAHLFGLVYSPETKVIEDIVRSICSKDELKLVKELSIREENKKRGLSCSVHKPPDFTVGLDVPLKVLKSQLLKEKEQQLLVTAPGGCGKTTLVTMLCQDKQIKSI
jgi:hypothetical protein